MNEFGLEVSIKIFRACAPVGLLAQNFMANGFTRPNRNLILYHFFWTPPLQDVCATF